MTRFFASLAIALFMTVCSTFAAQVVPFSSLQEVATTEPVDGLTIYVWDGTKFVVRRISVGNFVLDATGGGSATNVFFTAGQNTSPRVDGGSNTFDVVGTLTNSTTGNAATATLATNAIKLTGPLTNGMNYGSSFRSTGAGAFSDQFGYNAFADGEYALAVGYGSSAAGDGALAIGPDTIASQPNAIALGNGATATGNASVAIGAGVTADTANTIKLGTATHAVITEGTNVAALFVGDGVGVTNLSGTNIASGTIAPARLGSGSGGATKFLREDSTWQTVAGGDLLAANNLGDVANAGTARTNLVAHDASNLTTGTVPPARLAPTVTTNNAELSAGFLLGGNGGRGATNVGVGSGLSLSGGVLAATGGGGENIEQTLVAGSNANGQSISNLNNVHFTGTMTAGTINTTSINFTNLLLMSNNPPATPTYYGEKFLWNSNGSGMLFLVTANINALTWARTNQFVGMDTTLTAGRVPYATTDGRLKDSAGHQFTEASGTLSVSNLNLLHSDSGTINFQPQLRTGIMDAVFTNNAGGNFYFYGGDVSAGDSDAPLRFRGNGDVLTMLDDAYNGTIWNGSLVGASRNALRDKFEALPSETATLTGKTYDAGGTGNVLKFKSYVVLRGFDNATGALPVNTNDFSVSTFMQPVFLNGTDAAANYIEWRTSVPDDLDTSVELRGRVKFKLLGADTGGHRYVLSFASVAASAAYAGTVGTAINLDFAGDGSGADGDFEQVGFTTLTGWAAGLTPGDLMVVRLARDGDTSDTSTVNSAFSELTIEYGVTQ